MGMSTRVVGFCPPDEKWQQMKAIWDACEQAGMSIPHEVEKFFNWETPDEAGIEIELEPLEYATESREGYDIILSTLPEAIDRIRFYNSW